MIIHLVSHITWFEDRDDSFDSAKHRLQQSKSKLQDGIDRINAELEQFLRMRQAIFGKERKG